MVPSNGVCDLDLLLKNFNITLPITFVPLEIGIPYVVYVSYDKTLPMAL